MSGPQIAHFLKQVGEGSEWAGIGAVYHAGWFVGACQALTAMIAVYALSIGLESGAMRSCKTT